MDRQEKLKEIRRLTIYLNTCRDEYYNKNNPSILDQEYDDLFDRLKSLEEETNFFFSGSPTRTVGYTVNTELPKIKHKHLLLSLDKTKDWDAAAEFTKDKEALIMYKLDGLTICIVYENGELVEASTRGNGEEGSIITDNAKVFMNLPVTISYKKHLKITGEGIIHINDFNRINDTIRCEEDKFKTPRNLAGGSVQSFDSGVCARRNVFFYAFNVIEGLDEINSLGGRLDAIHDLGFDTCKYTRYIPESDHTKFYDIVNNFVDSSVEEFIPIDGIVIMYDDIAYGYSLGKNSHHYRNGIALKFKEEEEESVITGIEWQVGRTGKITPVAIFKPVILDNTNVSKASLHNISVMKKLGIRKNARITIVKKNQIIPQIIKSEGGNDEFDVPKVCPVCGGTALMLSDSSEEGTVSLYCRNDECSAQCLRKISYFVSKECMNIDGLSEKTIEKFIDAGIISNILDIYKLDRYHDEIVEFEGMGEKSYEKLIAAVEKSKNVKLENFIAALGIPNVALSKSKIISKTFNGDWNEFENAVKTGYDFKQLDSFGRAINSSINMFFNNIFWKDSDYSELVSLMNFVVEKMEVNDVLNGKVFVITGSIEKFRNRKELQEEILSYGGKIAGSVSSKTDYLINNDIKSHSSKNKNAKANGIPIITEDDFLNMINMQK